MNAKENSPVGALRLLVSVELLQSILRLPEGIEIKKIEHNFGEEVAALILFGESLPSFNKRNGEIAEGTMWVSQRHIPVINYSAIYYKGDVIAEQNWNDQ
jgi:hypothetical protein